MKIYLLHFIIIVAVLLTGCHTGKKVVLSHSRQPKFIDDIYLDGHNKSNITTNAIDRNIKPADKKYVDKKYVTKKISEADGKRVDADIPKACVSKSEAKELRNKYADMLGVEKKEISNYALYSFIDEWYGTAYHMGGQDKSGIDCSGFAKKLYETVFGIDLAHSSIEQYSSCQHLKKGCVYDEGDLVFFKINGRGVSHVGVYLMNDYFVHASTSQGVMISNLKEEYWQKHFMGAGKARKG